jgi:hypothetical protein
MRTTWLAVYIKILSLLAYANGDPKKQIALKIDIYGIFRKNLYLNIATNYDYEETYD